MSELKKFLLKFVPFITVAILCMIFLWIANDFFPEYKGFALGLLYGIAYTYGEYSGKKQERTKHE